VLCPACFALLGCPVCFALYADTPLAEQGPAEREPPAREQDGSADEAPGVVHRTRPEYVDLVRPERPRGRE
jgi:hypothetical protein